MHPTESTNRAEAGDVPCPRRAHPTQVAKSQGIKMQGQGMPCPKKPLHLAENFTSLRSKLTDPSLKSINKTYICKNKTNIYINKTIICTNITFIYTFLRSATKNPLWFNEFG